MLEEMAAFFEKRLAGYDNHMLRDIDGAEEFYPFTASVLPMHPCARVLDLGCGTGLELEWYFKRNPSAEVMGIDLSAGMLQELQKKFSDKRISCIQGSYFEVPFGSGFDAAVSVESLHHFTKQQKVLLYRKLCSAVKTGGWFVLTDYFAASEEEEYHFQQELLRLKAENQIVDDRLYHFDTPLTVAHEMETLREAGFSEVKVLAQWNRTNTIFAFKDSL